MGPICLWRSSDPLRLFIARWVREVNFLRHRLHEQLTEEGTLKLCLQHSTTQDLYDHHYSIFHFVTYLLCPLANPHRYICQSIPNWVTALRRCAAIVYQTDTSLLTFTVDNARTVSNMIIFVCYYSPYLLQWCTDS